MEYEYDHVLIGTYNGPVNPNSNEVNSYCYQSMEEVKAGLSLRPDNYTEWFKIALPKLEEYLAPTYPPPTGEGNLEDRSEK